MNDAVLTTALGLLLAAEMAGLWLVLKSRSMLDRLIAAVSCANMLTFILAVCGALKGSSFYYEAALVTALLSSVSTIILSKFIGTGEVL